MAPRWARSRTPAWPAPTGSSSCWRRCAAAAQRLVDAAQPGATPTLVLPLDQAEELFSADAGPQAEQFLGLLTQLVSRINVDEVGLLVAATIRTDRYEVMQNHPALAGVGSVLFDELKPMPATQFKEVITGPAARSSAGGHRLTIAPDLVNRLLADAAEGADTLPLLALTLARLYADYASSGELTLANYEAMGGMRRVVQNAIDEVLAANPGPRDRQLQLLRSAFVPWLATINPDNDQPLRRVAHYNDLPAASRPLIDALVEKRLLIRDERDGKVVIEVALESLLRQWDELAGWLREERQHLKSADDIERNATAWATRGHDPAWLLTGTRLSDAETLSATPGFRSRLAGTRGYLAASRNTEDRKREAEEQHRQAELRHAEEVARLAQESQRLAQERQQAAEAHTVDLRKRARLLRAVLAATVVIAVAAAFGFVQTWYAKRDVQQKYLESTALRLATDSSGILAGDRPGNDIRAFQELLAAQAIDPKYDAALLDAQAKRFSTVKILNAGGKISMSALSPDGHLFAATSGDKLQLWDVDAGRPVGDAVPGENGVAFSPDGKLVATGGSNNTVLVYGVDKRDLKQTLSGPGRVMARIAFSRDGQTLAAASLDGTVWLWNPNTGQAIRTLRPDSHKGVVAVAFSPDGAHLATGGADRQVLVWETSTGRLERSIPGHDGEVTGLAYDFDGKVLASVGHDRKIKFWDDTGKSIRDPLTTDDAVMDVAFDPQPTLRLASTGSSGTVNLWNFDHGEVIQSALPGHAGQSQALTFSANGGRLAVGSEDGLIRVWNPDRGEPMTASIGGVNGVAYSQDGTRIVSASGDGSLQLWDPNTGQADGDAMPGGADGLMSVAISPDARTVVAGDGAGNVQVWNPNTRKLIRKLTGHQGNVNSVAFSPDGNLIASGGEDGLIMIWNAETGQTRTLTGHDGYVNALTFSHDGHRIISGGTDSKAIVWNVDTGDRVVTIDNGAYVDGLALSPDGHDLVTGGADALIRRWNADTGASLGAQMVGHGNAVPAIAYSPDGRQIISGSYDKTVRLWDAKTGKPIGTPMTGHTNFITSLAVSPNGQLVVSGSQDYTLRLWPITASVSDLCAKLTTNMSQKHWREWVAPDIRYRTACPGLPIAPD